MRVDRQPGYLLHARAYRESSQLLDVLTPEFGLVRLVGRGTRSRASGKSTPIQPFCEGLFSWQGKGELHTLAAHEEIESVPAMQGTVLVSALYVNELAVRLLAPGDPCPGMYECYRSTILSLSSAVSVEPALRLFEKRFLSLLGYELNLTVDMQSGETVDAEAIYRYDIESGPVAACRETSEGLLISGRTLLALEQEDLDDARVLHEAKVLMRAVLNWHMDGRPLRSRELFNHL